MKRFFPNHLRVGLKRIIAFVILAACPIEGSATESDFTGQMTAWGDIAVNQFRLVNRNLEDRMYLFRTQSLRRWAAKHRSWCSDEGCCNPCCELPPNPCGFYLASRWNRGTKDDSGNQTTTGEQGFKYENMLYSTGVDLWPYNTFFFGASYTLIKNKSRVNDVTSTGEPNHIKVESHSPSIYFCNIYGDFYFDFSATWNFYKFRTTGEGVSGFVLADKDVDFRGDGPAASFNAGIDFPFPFVPCCLPFLCCLKVGPIVGADFTHIKIKRIRTTIEEVQTSEIYPQDIKSLPIRAGAQMFAYIGCPGARIIPRVYAIYEHETMDDQRDLYVDVQNTINTFKTERPKPGQLRLGGSFMMELTCHLSVYLYYEAGLANCERHENTAGGVVSYRF